MSYGFTVTAAGLNYLMKLQAGETMVIDSIMVGDGILADGTAPQSLTDLVHPLYYATSTAPVVTDNILRMTIEFRNRMENLSNDLPLQDVTSNFYLSEYGVFVRNGAGERILLYYGNLSEFPEPVIAFNRDRPFILVKRYPVEIVLLQGDITINLDYASAVFVTHDELEKRLDQVGYKVIVAAEEPEKVYNEWLKPMPRGMSIAEALGMPVGCIAVISNTPPNSKYGLWLYPEGSVNADSDAFAGIDIIDYESDGHYSLACKETVISSTEPTTLREHDAVWLQAMS